MITGLKGKIVDETGKPIPSVLVYVSDSEGKLRNEKARKIADLDGNYELPVSAPLVDPMTGKITFVKIGSHVTFNAAGFPRKIVPIDFSGTGIKKLDVQFFPMEQTLPEVTVTVNRDKYLCESKGGVYDEKTKTCKLPDSKQNDDSKPKTMKEKWNSLSKTKKTLIIAAGSAAVLGLIVLIVKASK